jgi:membrane protein required for colicin V production
VSWIDWVVVTVVALSLVVGLFRGFVREIVGLAGWIAAAMLATWYAEAVATQLPAAISEPVLRWAIGFVLVFLAVLVVASIVSLVVRRLMRAVGLGFADRMLGGAFGAVRGVAILVVAVLLVGLTPLRDDPSWRDAHFVGPLQGLAELAMPWLPEQVRERLAGAVTSMQDPAGVAARALEVSGAMAGRAGRSAP